MARVELRPIKIGIKSEISAEVTDGLKEKEQVVIGQITAHGQHDEKRAERSEGPLMPSPLLELNAVSRTYTSGGEPLTVLTDVSLTIQSGEFVAIMGASGSGKSTLMNIIGCLDKPSSGTYRIRGVDVASLDGDALAALRRDTFGFIFQRYNLMSDLSAVENAEVPAVYRGMAKTQRAAHASDLLRDLGLGDRLQHHPNQLSGGQQQRVSIARALMNGGPVILADEPTGALDSQGGKEVMAILEKLHGQGHTIILVTHDSDIAAYAHRLVRIADGRITSDEQQQKAEAGQSGADRRTGKGRQAGCGGPRRISEDGVAFAAAQSDANRADHAGHHHRRRLGGRADGDRQRREAGRPRSHPGHGHRPVDDRARTARRSRLGQHRDQFPAGRSAIHRAVCRVSPWRFRKRTSPPCCALATRT